MVWYYNVNPGLGTSKLRCLGASQFEIKFSSTDKTCQFFNPPKSVNDEKKKALVPGNCRILSGVHFRKNSLGVRVQFARHNKLGSCGLFFPGLWL